MKLLLLALYGLRRLYTCRQTTTCLNPSGAHPTKHSKRKRFHPSAIQSNFAQCLDCTKPVVKTMKDIHIMLPQLHPFPHVNPSSMAGPKEWVLADLLILNEWMIFCSYPNMPPQARHDKNTNARDIIRRPDVRIEADI